MLIASEWPQNDPGLQLCSEGIELKYACTCMYELTYHSAKGNCTCTSTCTCTMALMLLIDIFMHNFAMKSLGNIILLSVWRKTLVKIQDTCTCTLYIYSGVNVADQTNR